MLTCNNVDFTFPCNRSWHTYGNRNCYSTHLLRYVAAKLLHAVKRMKNFQSNSLSVKGMRLTPDGEVFFTNCWNAFVSLIGVSQDYESALSACLRLGEACLCKEGPLTVEDWESIRSYFKERGAQFTFSQI